MHRLLNFAGQVLSPATKSVIERGYVAARAAGTMFDWGAGCRTAPLYTSLVTVHAVMATCICTCASGVVLCSFVVSRHGYK